VARVFGHSLTILGGRIHFSSPLLLGLLPQDPCLCGQLVNPAADGSDGRMVRNGREQLRFEGKWKTGAA